LVVLGPLAKLPTVSGPVEVPGSGSGRRLRLTGALASRNFRLLAGCDVTSQAGSAMATVAVPFAVLRAGGSATDVGLVTAAGIVPAVALLLFGGVLADRIPRQRIMVAANTVQALSQAVFAAAVLTGRARLWEMAVLTAIRGAANAFYLPAATGLLPQTVPAEHLSSANAIARLGMNSAQILGAALGGVVVGLLGPGWGLVADSASFAVAAALRAGMRLGALPTADRAGFLSELREGWRAFTARRWLWAIVVQFGLVNAVQSGGFSVLGPVVADHRLGGAASWGAIVAAEAIGSVAGAALMVRWRPVRLLRTASLAVPLLGLPLLALAVPLSTAVIAAAAFACGAGGEIFEVNWSTAMQQQIPSDMLSRVSAYDALGSFALSPVGTAAAGPIAAAVGLTAALAGGGVLIVASAVCVLFVAEVRHLTRRPPAPEELPTADAASAAGEPQPSG
jgi:MFS family permease